MAAVTSMSDVAVMKLNSVHIFCLSLEIKADLFTLNQTRCSAQRTSHFEEGKNKPKPLHLVSNKNICAAACTQLDRFSVR